MLKGQLCTSENRLSKMNQMLKVMIEGLLKLCTCTCTTCVHTCTCQICNYEFSTP